MSSKIIAIDFDGTLATDNYPGVSEPIMPMIDRVKREKAEGSKIILWTCRADESLARAVEFCERHGIEFDAVNENLPESKAKFGNNPRKIHAHVYVDDRSVNAADWGTR
jgi:2-hydroxy-3-keto-5-methylthiopentenyl-1-phosphate phosphatase